jgi:hypothetical protein
MAPGGTMLLLSTLILSSVLGGDNSAASPVTQDVRSTAPVLHRAKYNASPTPMRIETASQTPSVDTIKEVVIDASSISEADLETLIVQSGTQRYHLRISGVCHGRCSRLLLANASKVTFEVNSFAMLTDTSVPARYEIFDSMFADNFDANLVSSRRANVSREDILAYSTAYETARAEGVESDMNLTRGKLRDPGHFFLQRLELNRLSSLYRGECALNNTLGVVLTQDYFLSQRWDVSGQKAELIDREALTELASQSVGNLNLAYAYGTRLINHTRHGTRAAYLCDADVF